MASNISVQDVAWGRFDAAGVALATRGNIAFARSVAGVYTATLGDGGVDESECEIIVTSETANIIAQVVHTSDTVKTINTFLGSTGAATDAQCSVTVRRLNLS